MKKGIRRRVVAAIMMTCVGVGLFNGQRIVQAYDNIFNKKVGWNKIDDKWYYYNEKKEIVTGWKEVEGDKYYLDENGAAINGWREIDGTKYFFKGENVEDVGYGSLAKGRCYVVGKWSLFDENGLMETGLYENNGKYYYSDNEGNIVKNQWIDIKDNQYYVKSDGSIATGDLILDGVLEKFDSNGRYIGRGEIGENLYVKHLYVGNADCAFIRLPNGETVLIDSGDAKDESRKTVVDFLKSQNLKEVNGVPTIDYIVITHAHSDHIGGLAEVLRNFGAGKVYIPEIGKMQDWHSDLVADEKEILQADIDMLKFDYDVYVEAEKELKNRNLEFINTVKGEYIDSEKILQFMQSDKDYGEIGSQKHLGKYWGLNENSAVIYLNYGDLQELFTGDIEWSAEADFVKDDMLNGKEVDVLKVPHHGYQTSATVAFDKYVNAKVGMINRTEDQIANNSLAPKNLVYAGTEIKEMSDTVSKGGIEIIATKDNWILVD